MDSKSKDTLYARPFLQVSDFVFDHKVAEVFDDMIKRSVPGYGAIISMIGCLAEQYGRPNSHYYDLGSSLGAASFAILNHLDQDNCRLIAVDNSPAMAERCRSRLAALKTSAKIDVQCADIRDVPIEQAAMVVLNFTLQFIEPERRAGLMKRICAGMLDGGVLVISEKIKYTDPFTEELQNNLHHTFKKLNGYSDLEISQKRTALDRVLISDTLENHQQRLHDAGFRQVHVWFQCFNFVSILAFK